jgi:hypothetical protein
MRIVELDAQNCTSVLSFYDALLRAIEAPRWHGHSIGALIDSMVWGGINGLEPPCRIRVTGSHALAADVRTEILEIAGALMGGRADHVRREGTDVEISLEIES